MSDETRHRRKPRDYERIRWRQLVTRAEKDPSVFRQDCCRQPGFCEELFHRCHRLASGRSRKAVTLARSAVELSEEIDDPHLCNRSHEVLASVYIALGDPTAAGEVLEGGLPP